MPEASVRQNLNQRIGLLPAAILPVPTGRRSQFVLRAFAEVFAFLFGCLAFRFVLLCLLAFFFGVSFVMPKVSTGSRTDC